MSTENEKKPAKSTPKKTAAKAPAKKAVATAAAKPAPKKAAAAPKTAAAPKKAATPKPVAAATSAGIPEAVPPARRQPTHDEIAYRAYFIFVGRGGHHGRHEDDWRRAELELLGLL